MAGRYDDAVTQVRPSDAVLVRTIAIARGQWFDAAQAMEVEADQRAVAPDAYVRCEAALFRAFAGDAHAFDRIHKLDASCEVLRALTLPDDEQAAALDRALQTGKLDRDDERILQIARATLRVPLTQKSFDAFRFASDSRIWWFMPLIAKAHGDDKRPFVRDAIAGQLAVLDTLRGDLAAAQHDVDAISKPDAQIDAQFDVDFAAGRPVTPSHADIFTERAPIRNRGDFDHAFKSVDMEQCSCELPVDARLAGSGEGGPLARLLTLCPGVYGDRDNWMALLPRVKRHRAELASALRQEREDFTTANSAHVPFRLIEDLSRYRTVSHLIGDDEEARRLQTIIDRHAALLTDPHKLLAFLLLTQY